MKDERIVHDEESFGDKILVNSLRNRRIGIVAYGCGVYLIFLPLTELYSHKKARSK
jgi:hypothetical protein